jgi:uncharacterized membrane protein YfcA
MSGWLIQDALGVASGAFVGFSLGLVGGGGSILAVPLLIYLVGVPSIHVAIGTVRWRSQSMPRLIWRSMRAKER